MLILSPRHFIFLKLNLKQFCNIFHDCCSQLCTTTEKWSWPPGRVFCRQSRAFFAAAVSLCRLTIKSPSRRSTRAPDHLCLEYPGRLMAWLLWNLERKVQKHRATLCLGRSYESPTKLLWLFVSCLSTPASEEPRLLKIAENFCLFAFLSSALYVKKCLALSEISNRVPPNI